METSIRRYVPLLIAGALLLAAACSDTVAPSATAPASTSLSAFAGTASARIKNQPRTLTLVLHAKGGHAKLGDFTLEYPAGAVCDPATSSYGPDFLTTPCQTLT